MTNMKCLARYIHDKDIETSKDLGSFYVSVRPSQQENDDGTPRNIIVSLHGRTPDNVGDAYHFALYPDSADRLGNALLDITDPQMDA